MPKIFMKETFSLYLKRKSKNSITVPPSEVCPQSISTFTSPCKFFMHTILCDFMQCKPKTVYPKNPKNRNDNAPAERFSLKLNSFQFRTGYN